MARRPKRSKSFKLEKAVYQPVDWRDLVGYEDAMATFRGLVQSGRLPPSVLIEGREGGGKRVFIAYICALVWCHKGTACGKCDPCRSIQNFQHEDTFWLESVDGKNYGLEQTAALQEHLAIKASSSQSNVAKRIVTVIDCDLLNHQSENRLLKILEEPPDDSLLLLSSSCPGQLLPTFLSRLFRYRVRPPTIDEGVSWLGRSVGPEHSEDKIATVYQTSGLSIGVAQARLESGVDLAEDYQGLVDAFFAKHPAESIELIEREVKQKKVPANELAKRIEVILNQYYKVVLGLSRDLDGFVIKSDSPLPTLHEIRHWRHFLKEVKALAIGGKIALNAQLIAESWALARHR